MAKFRIVLTTFLFLTITLSYTQDILLIDRTNEGDIILNDTEITVYSTDTSIIDLTKLIVMKNNTDSTLYLNLRKEIHIIQDSTIDYFCFGPKCWPDTDTTDSPAIIPAGEENYTFASHVVHIRRFENPPLPPGFTSITYTVFDNTTFSEEVSAKVKINYHLSPVGIAENKNIDVSVFPNPARHNLSVKADKNLNGIFGLKIVNITGMTVMEKQVLLVNGCSDINIEELDIGMYFGVIIQDNRQNAFFKFQVY